jgi:hypothetical protein
LAALWLAACGRGDEHGFKPPPPVVEVVTVEPELVRDTITLVGQLDSESSVEVRPEIDGIIESIDFIEGQSVKKGTCSSACATPSSARTFARPTPARSWPRRSSRGSTR